MTTQTATKTSQNNTTYTGLTVTVEGRIGGPPKVSTKGKHRTEVFLLVNVLGKKEADLYTVVLWDKPADVVADYCEKGGLIKVTGQLTFDYWTDKNTGEPRRSAKINVNLSSQLKLVAKSKKQTNSTAQTVPSPVPVATPVSAQTVNVPAQEIQDEDWNNLQC